MSEKSFHLKIAKVGHDYITPKQVKAVISYLKLQKIGRCQIKLRKGGRIELQVSEKDEAIASYILFSVFSRTPDIKMKVTRLPWWKFWVFGIIMG